MNNIWKNRKITMKFKMRLFDPLILPVALYGAECWQLKTTEQRRLDAFQLRCLRRILGVTYKDRVTNAEIYRRTEQYPLTKKLSWRRLRYVGHLTRMRDTRLTKQSMTWIPPGGKRPRMTWKKNAERDLEMMNFE